METEPVPPADLRPLGRSRAYTADDLPARLLHWHAPRANRWQRLCVTADRLCTQWLGVGGVTSAWLRAGESRLIAPGTRWRVTEMPAQTRFELQIFAADALFVSAPQPLRAALFDAAESVVVADGEAFVSLIDNLAPGDSRLLKVGFDCAAPLRASVVSAGQHLFWHPLSVDGQGVTAFIARSAEPVGLLEYLGRDHAVIEAALARALRGDARGVAWLHASLQRHLAIEEQLLFPAYLKAGGREAWVRGLCNEHAHLRKQLDLLFDDDADVTLRARRRFTLLLDGHDEKEEQIVYPDILARVGADLVELTRAAILYPLAAQ